MVLLCLLERTGQEGLVAVMVAWVLEPHSQDLAFANAFHQAQMSKQKSVVVFVCLFDFVFLFKSLTKNPTRMHININIHTNYHIRSLFMRH